MPIYTKRARSTLHSQCSRLALQLEGKDVIICKVDLTKYTKYEDLCRKICIYQKKAVPL